MTSSTIPDPAPGQVWEDRDPRGMSGRRVRILPGYVWTNRFDCEVIAFPSNPARVGRIVSLARGTLRSKWRFVREAVDA